MNIRQKLLWFLTSGVTETIGETPVNRFAAPAPELSTVAQITPAQTSLSSTEKKPDTLSEKAHLLATEATNLADLYRLRAGFEECPPAKTATHTVNGRGTTSPRVLCLIGTPDATDDRSGVLCSGEVGVLLDKMLSAIGLNLSDNTYVSALMPWRLPGNRRPTPTESALCRPFWEREIEFLKPQFILVFGAEASSELLGIDNLSKARSGQHTYKDIPVFVTFAPTTVIKLPAQRRPAWEDLKKFKEKLDESLP